MPSIGAKGLVCPSGEQITNGGFETGDFTGWTYDPSNTGIWGEAHSGSYAAWIRYDSCASIGYWIKQAFATPIPVECVKSFSLWITGWCSGYNAIARVHVNYDDGTETVKDFSVGWYYVVDFIQCSSLKTVLVAGKKIVSILIEADTCDISVDDVSLVC